MILLGGEPPFTKSFTAKILFPYGPPGPPEKPIAEKVTLGSLLIGYKSTTRKLIEINCGRLRLTKRRARKQKAGGYNYRTCNERLSETQRSTLHSFTLESLH